MAFSTKFNAARTLLEGTRVLHMAQATASPHIEIALVFAMTLQIARVSFGSVHKAPMAMGLELATSRAQATRVRRSLSCQGPIRVMWLVSSRTQLLRRRALQVQLPLSVPRLWENPLSTHHLPKSLPPLPPLRARLHRARWSPHLFTPLRSSQLRPQPPLRLLRLLRARHQRCHLSTPHLNSRRLRRPQAPLRLQRVRHQRCHRSTPRLHSRQLRLQLQRPQAVVAQAHRRYPAAHTQPIQS